MARLSKCDCRHLGQCPFQADPLVMVDAEGQLLFRALTDEEKLRSRLVVCGQDLHEPETGDFVVTDGKGTVHVLAKAIDPDRPVTYARTKVDRACKATSFIWRKLHPIETANNDPSECP